MAYVQEHKLGLNVWQLNFFLSPLWGVGEMLLVYLSSNRGNSQAWTLVLICIGPSDNLYCASSQLPLKVVCQVMSVASGCAAGAVNTVFVLGHRFPSPCFGSQALFFIPPAIF